MHGRRLLIASVSILLLASIAIGLWYHDHRRSPAYALDQLREAVEEQNALKFERYAQVHHFAEAFIDDVFSASAEQALADAGGEDGWGALGSVLGMGMIERLKPTAVSMTESAIREAIETGRADSVIREASAQENQVDLASLLESAAIDPNGYRGMTEINEEGDVATVGFRFHNTVYDTTVIFQVKLEQQNDRWQLIEPYNFGRLLRAVSARKDSLLAQANRTMREEAESMVDFGELHRSTSRTCTYCSEDLHLELPITNISDRPLDLVSVTLTHLGEPLDDGDFTITSFRDISPGTTVTLKESVDYNQFLDWHSTLLYGSLTPQIEMIFIRPPDSSGTRFIGQIDSMSDLERFSQREQGPGILITDDPERS